MAKKDVIVLIPPSEGKQAGGSHSSLKKFSPEVQQIANRLDKVKKSEWEKLLGVKGKALEQAILANQSIAHSQTMPAIQRYTGVVYNALDYDTLKSREQKYIVRHVRIVSALFGLVQPDQLIPDYKLKIDKLQSDKYWKPILSEQLQDSFVIDLLPKAHKKAVGYSQGCAPDFLFLKDGRPKPAGHNGKHIKGRFIRFLAQNGVTSVEQMSQFAEDGFRYVDGNFIKKV